MAGTSLKGRGGRGSSGSNAGSVVVIAAHSDDQILGPGGTVAKYAREGKNVFTIIFSFGAMSDPWMKPLPLIKTRIKEARKADRVIGGKGVYFLGLKENKFKDEFQSKNMLFKLSRLLKKLKPELIFTHASDDPHPDHRAVHQLVLQTYDAMKKEQPGFDCSVYVFDVWTVLNLKTAKHPRMIVDITKTFKTKIKVLGTFKSQRRALLLLLWSVYVRAIMNGFRHNKRLAEVFYKVR